MSATPTPEGGSNFVSPDQLRAALAELNLFPTAREISSAHMLGVLLAFAETALHSVGRMVLMEINSGYSEMLSLTGTGTPAQIQHARLLLLKERIERTALTFGELSQDDMTSEVVGPVMFAVSNMLAIYNETGTNPERMAQAFDSADAHMAQAQQGLAKLRAHYRDERGYTNL